MSLSTKGLRRETTRTHTDEGAVPVDEVEDGNADGQRSDGSSAIAIRHTPCDEGGGDAHKGHGDVGYDIGNCDAKYVSIHIIYRF
jgi:hypothetical protein